MRARPLVIFGGAGVFGSLVVDDLLANTDAHLTLAGRRFADRARESRRLSKVVRDLVEQLVPLPLATADEATDAA